MSGVDGFYTDSRKVLRGDGSRLVVIPAAIVEEFELEKGDDLPFFAKEGEDKVTIMKPNGDVQIPDLVG